MHAQSSSIASPPRERIEDALRASFPAGHVTTRVDRWRSLLTTLGDSTAKKNERGVLVILTPFITTRVNGILGAGENAAAVAKREKRRAMTFMLIE